MAQVNSKCAMIGCKRPVYQSLAIGPGTVIDLCAEHFAEEKGDPETQKAAYPGTIPSH